MRREASDLSVKFFDLALVRGDDIRSVVFLVKERRQFFERSIAPLPQLIRMNLMLGCQLRKRLGLFEQFEDEFGFEGRSVLLSHGGLVPP